MLPLPTGFIPTEDPHPQKTHTHTLDSRVWVSPGMGTGRCGNTHGLPMVNTIYPTMYINPCIL